ncbi:MAG: PHP domain-containing protein, partial [Comamonadaceae bacterium]
MTERNYDLHCHSNRSDGILAPAEVAARAHANGVDVLALTDHDEVSGVAEVMQAGQSLGLHVVPGVEISVTFAGVTVHIVGLNFDPTNADLLAGLAATRLGRTSRAVEMGKRLETMGMPGAYEGALQFVSNPQMIGRTHFARYLVQAGF